ncbi:class I SAM-dependent DNA methyltransferase [Pontibacter cellulosilyticus]|uniref:site-specific DNA-methyltransferase (adenine-specific) n=1 Tax=Pontibacter cellulosilyticus TaxID=1720253 RepID=A0A923SKM8_9BACT|nr:class I SAM-dependent DNA methyltransferase [Pontibacter cellulosilyticus]MBC5995109.1 class I SAM-dependent DNA methyltransferase [Pontibacter cellulosilyticus]
MSLAPTLAIQNFITRWKASGASERANYQLFLSELCELLGVEKPQPATDKVHEAYYTFERPVVFDDGEGKTSTNFIDLYKKDCFVLEAKQGADKASITEAELLGGERAKTKTGTATRDTRTWDREMKKAKEQALRYARSLPTTEGWPPFLAVVDVGYCIDLYADFARQGKTYVPFPDPQNYRVTLEELAQPDVRERLRLLFTDPLELDPSRRAARVTRALAERLAKLAASLENTGYTPEQVSGFLMRCLFTMFAEDVELLPKDSFKELLKLYRQNIQYFPSALKALWENMDKGGFAPALHREIPQFNGYLFKNPEALPISEAQLDLLIDAADASWTDVEPAIFGTLLERALQPRERHKLGAHYTPRAYVERLVMPTVIEPLREEWEAARTASAILEDSGDEAGARKEIESFHRRLCSVRVLDPACGSGNFLYVTLEHLKRLEGEVLEYLEHFPRQLKMDMTGGFTVTPAQLLGLEVNPRAAAIADVVLWIGYLQWHFRAHGSATRLSNPILREYGNIKQQDAVLSYTDRKPRLDSNGQPVTRWDGHSTKPHPVTGQEVPDETARTIVYDYLDPKPATWPEADFIVGNPPFIGPARMREALGDGYTEALRKVYKGAVPESADFVMFWWHKAAELVRADKAERFGFITTNSIKQTFNRRVIEAQMQAKPPLSITLAIPDHPWVDSADGAAVEIAMSVAEKGETIGRLLSIVSESKTDGLEVQVSFKEKQGKVHPDFTIGAAIVSAKTLKANENLCSRGVQLIGAGFIVEKSKAEELGYGRIPEIENFIRNYRNGRDLTSKPREVMVIDLFGLTIDEVRTKFPEVYQWVYERVKPERDQNNRESYRKNWWIHGEARGNFRPALKGLERYLATVETSKHRFFTFIDKSVLADNKLLAIALEDPYFLGVMSSKYHVTWALAAGADLGGNTPVYVKTTCFETFPFPAATETQQEQIRSIAEQLDAHRKQRQAQHPTLTITDMYNVLEKLRSGEPLNAKEQKTHEQGLVSILLQLHTELDAAVAAAYSWPTNLPEEEILERLVALNKERAAEEARGHIRWLRPAYQNPQGTQQTDMGIEAKAKTIKATAKETLAWPKTLTEQAQAVQRALQLHERPATADDLLHQFKPASKQQQPQRLQQIDSLLQTLHGLGLLRKTGQAQYIR